jgi:hypothetical protein
MKLLAAVAILFLAALAAPALAQTPQAAIATTDRSPAFGAPGTPRFDPYPLPEDLPGRPLFAAVHNAGEPTIGIPWNTDHLFFQAFANTYRASFDDTQTTGGRPLVKWDDVSPAFTAINVDPILIADPVSGRIFAGGLAGPCSLLGISDNDGASWTPAGNACSGAQFDHESIASGRWSTTSPDTAVRQLLYPRATYYCGQLEATACSVSLDGGQSWQPWVEMIGGCGGLHGHIEVSEVTGVAAVPDGSCAAGEGGVAPGTGRVGFGYTTNNGATWLSRSMPDSESGDGFDPGLMFSRQSGWLWLGRADDTGVHVALSKDEGQTWETLGTKVAGGTPSTWFDLNVTYADPRTGGHLVYGAFTDIEAGDDDRVAMTYLATTNQTEDHPFNDCSEESDGNVWHYYLSQSFDAGQSWTTTRLWEDPVQVGAIWNGGGSDPCRNLLDFADMHIDSQGRIHVGFADGCTNKCSEKYWGWVNGTGPAPKGADSRDAWGTVLRQTTGRGLFAKYDIPDTFVPVNGTTQTQTGGQASPSISVGVLAVGVVAAAAVAGWRRRD